MVGGGGANKYVLSGVLGKVEGMGRERGEKWREIGVELR